jgi:hypothetical protein
VEWIEVAGVGDGLEKDEHLVAIVREVARTFTGMIVGEWWVVARDFAEFCGNFRGVVNPVGTEGERVANEGC